MTTPSRHDSEESYNLFTITTHSHPMMVPIQINGQHLDMELDTGAAISVISESTFTSIFKDSVTVQPSNIVLHTYLRKKLFTLGTVEVDITYETQKATLPLVIVNGEGASVFGRNWLKHIRLNWPSINTHHNESSIQELLKQQPGLFRHELGTLKGFEAKIFLPQNAQSRFYKPRPVLCALKHKVEELVRLLARRRNHNPSAAFQLGCTDSASSQVGWKNTNLW